MKGTVLWYRDSKGYGFITRHDEASEVFVHRSALPAGVVLQQDDIVTFDIELGPKGRPQAAHVKIVRSPAAAQ